MAKVIQTMSIMERAVQLMATDFLRNTPTDEVALIASKTTEVQFEPGEILNRDADYADSFILVVDGLIEHRRENSIVREARKGMATGLMALMGIDEPDDHIIEVREPTHGIVLSRRDFLDAISEHTEFAIEIIRSLATLILRQARRIDELEKERRETP